MDLTGEELELIANSFLLMLFDRRSAAGPPMRLAEFRDGLHGDDEDIDRFVAALDHLQRRDEIAINRTTGEIMLRPAGLDQVATMYDYARTVLLHEGVSADDEAA